MEMAFDAGALEEVIDKAADPEVERREEIEKRPSAAWPARRFPVPADWV